MFKIWSEITCNNRQEIFVLYMQVGDKIYHISIPHQKINTYEDFKEFMNPLLYFLAKEAFRVRTSEETIQEKIKILNRDLDALS